MVAAKQTKKGKACENRTKESPRTRVGPQVKQTALPASPIYIGKARGGAEGGRGGRKKTLKRGAKIELETSLLLTSFGSACPHASRMYSPLLAK